MKTYAQQSFKLKLFTIFNTILRKRIINNKLFKQTETPKKKKKRKVEESAENGDAAAEVKS